MDQRELLDHYGAVALAGNASLFVGAGLSQAAGYPGWNELLEPLRVSAGLPELPQDPPLLAQYYVDSRPGGLELLETHIIDVMRHCTTEPTAGHRFLRKLPVNDIWTTNYDTLLENSMPDVRIIANEADIVERRLPTRRRLTKMHGSFRQDMSGWRTKPVITRSSYEAYEHDFPRIWSMLRSTYLTRTFLFLGFSFQDPNVEILLRLSRTLFDQGAPEHFTVLRSPSDPADIKLHDLKVRDLERSGIAVCEISDFREIEPLLERLVRRTREPLLFVSGSIPNATRGGATVGHDLIRDVGKKLASRLADDDIEVVSLAGPAAMAVSFPLAYNHKMYNRYEPGRIRFYFREAVSERDRSAPPLEERSGTAIYTGKTRDGILNDLLPEVRAMVVLGGGQRTREEVEIAKSLQVPIVPIPIAGGVGEEIYHEDGPVGLLEGMSGAVDALLWRNLGVADADICISAAHKLIVQAMFLTQS
jgi:hypothetical protein